MFPSKVVTNTGRNNLNFQRKSDFCELHSSFAVPHNEGKVSSLRASPVPKNNSNSGVILVLTLCPCTLHIKILYLICLRYCI